MVDRNQESIITFLKKRPGSDKFFIASELDIEVEVIQEILSELKGKRQVISGLEKERDSSTFNQLYYLSPQ